MELIYANIKTLSFIFKVSQNKKKQVINLWNRHALVKIQIFLHNFNNKQNFFPAYIKIWRLNEPLPSIIQIDTNGNSIKWMFLWLLLCNLSINAP